MWHFIKSGLKSPTVSIWGICPFEWIHSNLCNYKIYLSLFRHKTAKYDFSIAKITILWKEIDYELNFWPDNKNFCCLLSKPLKRTFCSKSITAILLVLLTKSFGIRNQQHEKHVSKENDKLLAVCFWLRWVVCSGEQKMKTT